MKILASSLSVLLATSGLCQAAGFEILKPHRAVYEVNLDEAQDRSGIKAMSGRIVYEVTGNECEGMIVKYRFVTKIVTSRDAFVTDQRTSTYESPDGKEFSFQTKSFVNDAPDQSIVGNAKLTSAGLQINLDSPQEREINLDKAVFTTTHLVDILEKAKSGVPFVHHEVFDGSGDADEVLSSASVIGKPRIYEKVLKAENAQAVSKLLEQKAWPITMSYFKNDIGNTGEETPVYEASFYLYGDGVTRQMNMRYRDYSLNASLSELEYYDPAPCQVDN